MKLYGLLFLTIALGNSNLAISSTNDFETLSASDVQSVVLRVDGKYDAVCKNGSTEVVTVEQIQEDKVCGGGCPKLNSEIEAVFSRPQGGFFALCKSNSWEVATAKMIHEGKACAVTPGLQSGTYINEHPIRVDVTVQGQHILMKYHSHHDAANGLYACSGKPAICVHNKGFRIIVMANQSFTWQQKVGLNTISSYRLEESKVQTSEH